MEDTAWPMPDDRPGALTLGVVASSAVVERVASVCADRDVDVVIAEHQEDPATVLDAEPAAVVVEGETVASAVARTGRAPPMLPVDAGSGLWSVDIVDLENAIADVIAGDARVQPLPLLAVDSGTDSLDAPAEPRVDTGVDGHALFDVSLIASDPARISEYRVRSNDRTVLRCRADGVVVATPVGTFGYTHSIGTATVDPHANVLSVAPIAPFEIRQDHWIVAGDARLELSVVRDEGAVSLLLDHAVAGTLSAGSSISVVADDVAHVIVVEASGSPLEHTSD